MKSISRKIAGLLLALILTCTVVGCGSSGSGNVSSQPKYQPSDLNTDLVQSYNQFALKLYAQLVEDSDGKSNLFISPTSIAAALAMTLNGANADTLSGMKQTLELQDISIEEINHSNQVLNKPAAIRGSRCAAEDGQLDLGESRKTLLSRIYRDERELL